MDNTRKLGGLTAVFVALFVLGALSSLVTGVLGDVRAILGLAVALGVVAVVVFVGTRNRSRGPSTYW